jgi:tRNA threonylcarbamoyladenosine modification (KEOPS) complex Cgi121 subunit
MRQRYQNSLFPRRHLDIWHYSDVTNAAALRQMLMDKVWDVALIRSDMVFDAKHVEAACMRVWMKQQNNKLSARSLHAELVYSLAANKNIGKSLASFGINETTNDLLLCVFDAPDDFLLSSRVEGTLSSTVFQTAEEEKAAMLRKYFKISSGEEDLTGGLSLAIVSRVATFGY